MIIQFILDLFRDQLMNLLAPVLYLYENSLITFIPALVAGIQYVNAFIGTVLPSTSWGVIMSLIFVTFLLAVLAPIVRFLIKVIRGT